MTFKTTFIRLLRRLGYDIFRRDCHPWGYAQMWHDLRRLVTASQSSSDDLVGFDVGAFRGDTVERIAALGPFDAIHAFEPLPDSFAVLERRFAGRQRVHLHNLAMSDRTGTAEFHLTRSSQSNSTLPPVSNAAIGSDAHDSIGLTTVQTATLDDIVEANAIERIQLLKLDVQGAEMAVLRGGMHLLTAQRVDVVLCEVEFIELYEKQPLFWDIAVFAAEHGLEFYGIYAPRPDIHGRMAWADAIFCRKQILERL